MSGKLFGVSIATIVTIVVVAVIVQKWGNRIPLLNKISA